MQVKVSAANMWVTIFIEIMQVGVSVAIMQVVFSMTPLTNYGLFSAAFYCNVRLL